MRGARIAIIAGVVAGVVIVAGVGYELLDPRSRTNAARLGATMSAGIATPSASPTTLIGGAASRVSPVPTRLRVATIGDSIMSGSGVDADQAWPMLLAAKDGVAVTNLGCGGAGFVAVGDCDTDYSGLVATAVADRPDVVIIQSSDNDFGQDDDDIAAATSATVASIRTALPSARIIGFSTLWDQPGDLPDQVASTSDALRTAIDAVGGTFIDLGQPLADQAEQNDEYGRYGDGGEDAGTDDSDDGDTASPAPSPSPASIAGPARLLQSDFEHPTAAGQQLLADAIQGALSAAGADL